MEIVLLRAGHIFSGQSAAHNGVIVMLDSPPSQFDVIEASCVAGLQDTTTQLNGISDAIICFASIDDKAKGEHLL